MTRRTIATLLVAAATAAGGVWACTDSSSPPVHPPPPPPPSAPPSLAIRPALDTVALGDLVTFVAERPDSTVDQWTLSDSNAVRIVGQQRDWARVISRVPGTVIIGASRQGDSGHATLVILPRPQPDTAGGWEAIDLGLLDGNLAVPFAINDSGTVVGVQGGIPGEEGNHGFIYKDGGMRKLPKDGTYNFPEAISLDERIVGQASPDDGTLLVWDSPAATPRRLPAGPAGFSVHPQGVNERGEVLANIENGHDIMRALVLRNDVTTDLGSLDDSIPGYSVTMATAWNRSGQIVGSSNVALVFPAESPPFDIIHPFIWEGGVMRDLGVLASFPCPNKPTVMCGDGEATDINTQGVVVGWSADTADLIRAFIWENGVMRDLGVYPGKTTSAFAINDRGQVLGAVAETFFLWDHGQVQTITTNDATIARPLLGQNGEVIGTITVGGIVHVFVWEAGHLTDIGPGVPVAINSRGEIIGTRGTEFARAVLWRKQHP
jgi:probable HAF family extracellular repeat protein